MRCVMEEEIKNIAVPEIVTTKPVKRRTTSRKRAPKVASSLPETFEAKEARSSFLLSWIANLTLLLAIFTIIFVAHRAIQNNGKEKTALETQENIPQTTQESAKATEVPAAVTPEQKVPEVAEAPKVTEAAPAEEKLAEEKPVAKEQPRKTKYAKKRAATVSDPYTSGGPLDLDNIGRNTAKDPQELNTSAFSDHRNPWNSGGAHDLDNPSNRNEYKKKNYLSSSESDK